MHKTHFLSLIGILAFVFTALGQLPPSQVYLFQLVQEGESSDVWLSKPRLLTAFNPEGYNNQPSFFNNNDLYLTVQTPADTTQTDVYLLNLDKGTKTRVTRTAESEFSPTLMPDIYYFSAVRIEADENGTQRLWQFPVDRMEKGRPVLPNMRNVGYHTWISRYFVALFIVGSPNLLVIADTRDGSWKRVTTDIGRCMQKLPNNNLAFLHKESERRWTIQELNVLENTFKPLAPALMGSEDFVVLPNGTLLSGQGSKLYSFRPGKSQEWTEIADLRNYGIKRITRLALSADLKLALVGQAQ